jgi:hypothetical protein
MKRFLSLFGALVMASLLSTVVMHFVNKKGREVSESISPVAFPHNVYHFEETGEKFPIALSSFLGSHTNLEVTSK